MHRRIMMDPEQLVGHVTTRALGLIEIEPWLKICAMRRIWLSFRSSNKGMVPDSCSVSIGLMNSNFHIR